VAASSSVATASGEDTGLPHGASGYLGHGYDDYDFGGYDYDYFDRDFGRNENTVIVNNVIGGGYGGYVGDYGDWGDYGDYGDWGDYGGYDDCGGGYIGDLYDDCYGGDCYGDYWD
jgi:hypothetical protein